MLSVATQQSWKDSNDEWQARTEWHRVVAFNRLGESIADTFHKGDHVLVDGQLVSSKYERENGKSRKAKAAKFAIFWSVRANSVRRLSRAEAEVPAQAVDLRDGRVRRLPGIADQPAMADPGGGDLRLHRAGRAV